MTKLILVRHGNTFSTGQTPTFVGGRTDMALTDVGEQQGHAIADMLYRDYESLSAIISGPLVRTKRFAEIIASKFSNVFTIDERLTEIDYGLWENKSNAEVEALFGKDVLTAWEEQGAWPEDMNWAPSQAKLLQNVKALLAEQHKKLHEGQLSNRVIITSNGILRFVYQAVTGKIPNKEAKVKTGHYCVLLPTAEGWTIEKWNASV